MISSTGRYLIGVLLSVLVVAFSVFFVVCIGLGTIIYEGWVREPGGNEFAK